MITDRRAAEQLNAFVAFLSGRAAEFQTKPLRNVDDRRTIGLLCAALIFVRRLQLVDCGSGTENLPKVIGRYDFLRLKYRERRLRRSIRALAPWSEHLRLLAAQD